MTPPYILNVAKDFSEYPGGRYRTDGEWSGERFRDDLLIPALRAHDCVVVELDDAMGCPATWLEEVFGGLVRYYTVDLEIPLNLQLTVVTDNKSYQEKVQTYIDEEYARARSRAQSKESA